MCCLETEVQFEGWQMRS